MYQVVDDEEYIYTNRKGEEILLYMINVNDFEKKANLKITTPIPQSHWYLDKYGRAYLLLDLDAKIPEWMLDSNPGDPDGPVEYDPNLESFVDRNTGGSGGGSCSIKDPTIPKEVLNEVVNHIFSYSEPDSNDNVTITGLNPIYSNYNLPNKIKFPKKSLNGYDIKGIDAGAFSGSDRFSEVTTIFIPEGYKTLGSRAFSSLNSIKAVYIPSTIETITGDPFNNCTNIEKIEVPNKIVSGEVITPKALFRSSETKINEVNFIGEILSIGDYAFSGFTALKEINIPCKVTSIGKEAYKNCKIANNKIVIPKTTTTIGESAFGICSAITEVKFEQGIDLQIGQTAFYDCETIREIELVEGIKVIGSSAFSGCSSVEKLTIPNTIQTMGINAFYGLGYIEELSLPAKMVDGTYGNTPAGILQFCGMPSNTRINQIYITGNPTVIIKDAFKSWTKIEHVEIPNTVKVIKENAFYSCSALISVTIPQSVEVIESYAFMSCRALTSIYLPNGNLTTIGRAVFDDCRGITSANIPASVTTMGDMCFYSCIGLKSATIDADIVLAANTFTGCSNLTQLRCKNSVNYPWGATNAPKTPQN